jgi:hypothetical protein
LCGPCYAGHVEQTEGPGPALMVLTGLLRDYQARVAHARKSEAQSAAEGPMLRPPDQLFGPQRR